MTPKFKLTKPYLVDEKDKRYKSMCKQIEQRGFDDSVTWSFNTAMADIILPMFKRFRDIHGYSVKDDEFQLEIDKMIKAFELIKDVDSWDVSADAEKNYELIEEGLESFKTGWSGLWW